MAQEATSTTGEQKPPEGQEPEPQQPESTEEPKGQEPEHFDKDYVKQLRREAADARTAKNKAEAKVKEFEERDLSDQDKLSKRAESAEIERDDWKSQYLRLKVGTDKGLPGNLAERLRGSTEEEMSADADELLKVAKDKGDTTTFDGGAREPAPASQSPEQAHNDLLLRLAGREPQQTT